jgi:hypothetical protein
VAPNIITQSRHLQLFALHHIHSTHLASKIMSQDQPAIQGQGDPKDGGAPAQSRGTFSPNIQPFDLMVAVPFATTPFGAGVPSFLPLTQDFFRRPLSNYAPQFSDFGDPFIGQFQGPPSFAMSSTEALRSTHNNEKPLPQPEFKSPKEHSSQPLARPLWPTYAPGHALQPRQTYSRLPSSDIGRKAPRKLDASSPAQSSSPQLVNNTPKSTQRRATKQDYRQRHGTSLASYSTLTAKSSATRATKPPTSTHRGTPRESLTSLKDLTPLKDLKSLHHTSTRSRPVVVANNEDESDDDDLPLSAIFKAKNAGTPVRRPTTTTTNADTQTPSCAAAIRSRPHPQFEYEVPNELESIHKALGEENWTNYIILMEQRCLKHITKAEFIAKSKCIFMVLNNKIRNRIESKIAKTMVQPAIQQQKKDSEEQ